MNIFKPKEFNIPELKGISKKTTEEHVKLYQGYVKHTNLILEQIQELKKDAEGNAYALGEINRRLGFEYNGMRNHEVYFASLEGTPTSINTESALYQLIGQSWGSYDAWLQEFKSIAKTRGVGWAMLYYDKTADRLLNAWIDEQHLGQLQGCSLILALDMWEHSFVADYQPSGKAQYIEDFFENLNWSVIEKNFANTQS